MQANGALLARIEQDRHCLTAGIQQNIRRSFAYMVIWIV
jgi:hypothetical protein